MDPLASRLEQASRNSVSLLESTLDHEARLRSRGLAALRPLLGGLVSLGLVLVLPFFVLRVWWREREEDRRRTAAGPPETGDAARSAAESPPEIDSRSAPICVMPLADFARMGAAVPRDAGRRFVLLAAVVYEVADAEPVGTTTDTNFKGHLVPTQDHLRQVPPGFITDFASIPWFMQRIAPPAGRYGRSAVFHDWAYMHHHDGSHRGRWHCDRAMLNLMRRDGVSRLGRSLVYAGLRIGGGWAFRTAPKRREAMLPYRESLVFPFLAVQNFMLGYLLRQWETSGLLDGLESRAGRTAASRGAWTDDVIDAVNEKQVELFGRVVF